jgi:spheroidene monooxygenase
MSSFPYVKPWTKPVQVAAQRDQAATALLLLADIKASARLWGYARFVLGTLALRRCEGLRFAKQLGSGENGGFGLKPSLSIQGLFLAFDHHDQALAFWHDHPLADRYRQNAIECFGLIASPLRARGSWSGQKPFEADGTIGKSDGTIGKSQALKASEPIAALTRASIRLRKAAAFWSKAPAAQQALAEHPSCLLAVGLGEAPLLRQATFSVWQSAEAMDAYARTGAHMAAIRAAGAGAFFHEDMFVRFKPLAAFGTWRGESLMIDRKSVKHSPSRDIGLSTRQSH